MNNTDIWKKTLAQIEIKLDSPAHFKTWFRDTRLIKIDGKKAVIGVKNSYTGDWLYKKHKNLIESTISFVYGKKVIPKFVFDKKVAQSQPPSQTKNKAKKERTEEPLLSVKNGVDETTHNRIAESNLNERYTFANYIVGASNRLAHAAAISVSENPGISYNPLFLYGSTGLGKTHLVQAVGRHILDSDANKRVLYCTTENFLNDMVESIRGNVMDRFRSKYRKLDVLIIDDIQLISNRKETQSEFFNTFNVLFQSSKQIVITSDRTPEEIPNIEKRLISRFSGGMVADIGNPDYEERVAILKQKARDFAIDLPERLIKYIAELVTANIRTLEGALQKVNLYNSLKKDDDLTMAEIAKIIGKDPNSKRKKVRLSTIFRKIADEFGVSSKEIKGPRRTKDIAFARQVCMYVLREEFGYKLQEVSELLKRNDHTTAIHGIDKVKSMMQTNLTFKEQIDNLISDIQRPNTEDE